MHAIGHDLAEENRALYKTPYSGKRPDRRRERIVHSYKARFRSPSDLAIGRKRGFSVRKTGYWGAK